MKLCTYLVTVMKENVDDSANTLLYAFLLLALNPAVQETLVREINESIGNRLPTYKDFPNLVYPRCVMFETLRLCPLVVGIPKRTQDREEMLLGKYYIPKNTTVLYDVVNLHRNPNYWGDDVETFNPGRFDGRNAVGKSDNVIKENIRLPIKGAFVPFSEGSRTCLGKSISSLFSS